MSRVYEALRQSELDNGASSHACWTRIPFSRHRRPRRRWSNSPPPECRGIKSNRFCRPSAKRVGS